MKTWFLALALVLITQSAHAEGQKFQSSPYRANLIELFSSEGCSSCPPADRWLSSLRRNSGLWRSFVPLEFHVDYWNYLGWVDRNAKESFTERQRDYARSWGTGRVYTPGFVLNGEEWRPSSDERGLLQHGRQVGELEAIRLSRDRYRVVFHSQGSHSVLILHGAILGNGLVTHVAAGENKGETLKHDFVVLALNQNAMKRDGTTFTAEIEIKPSVEGVAAQRSVAFWVTEGDEGAPIQAVGGDLSG